MWKNVCISKIRVVEYHSEVQWIAGKMDFLAVYDIKQGRFEWKLLTCKRATMLFFKLSANR